MTLLNNHQRCHVKKDTEIRLYLQERRKGMTQRVAAARAGIGERTARKYEQAAALPSQLKGPHEWKTRLDPFEEDWPWVVSELERDPALQGSTLFALLCERRPGHYRPTQVRTLQRHIQQWRALHGPDREVMFAQDHIPAEAGQSDFTHMEDLGVTLAGVPFPHLLHHFVLTYSNVEAVSVCFSESFEALAEGIEKALWQIGGVPSQHRTDHLTAAVKNAGKQHTKDWTKRYEALMAHYGMQPTKNNVSIAHENGDVEQSHHRFKQAVDQALRVRASRDFPSREAYERFLQDLIRTRNLKRNARFVEEQEVLRPLPTTPLAPCQEVRVTVSQFSTIHVKANVYSVPSRLIGTSVLVRLRAELVEGYVGSTLAFTLPRLVGKQQHRIDYRHVIWSLVRKPGAFAAYRYRDDLFPTTTFRLAYDRLVESGVERADRDYVRILHLAASTSESEVETALALLLEASTLPRFATVRDLVHPPHSSEVLALSTPQLDLSPYDKLIPSRRTYA
jgi:Mu transposase-like protein